MTNEYAENKAFVEHCWKRYAEKNDPRWLAEICKKLPFFENQQVGKEIARRLEPLFWKSPAEIEQVMHQDIWRLWRAWRGSDSDTAVRQRIADVFFVNEETGKPDGGGAERVRGIIRKFEELEN